MVRTIKIGKRTAGHAETLQAKGYEVVASDGSLSIQCSGVVEGEVDLSTPEKAKEVLSEVVSQKAVFSYTTKFIFPDGKVLFGVPACMRLGKASALVTKGEKEQKSPSSLDGIFAAL